jgi:hypothetical protein
MSNMHLARRGGVRMAAIATSAAIAIVASTAAGLASQNGPPGQGGPGQNVAPAPLVGGGASGVLIVGGLLLGATLWRRLRKQM